MTRLFGLAAGFLLGTLLAPAVSAAISIPLGLTDDRDALPGTTYSGVIKVLNTGEKTEEIKVYQNDYLFYQDGRSIYAEPGSHERSNAPWVTFSPKRAVIPPRGEVTIAYKVSVPAGTKLTGTAWSMLMVEPIPESSAESGRKRKDQISMGITQVFRFGYQLVTNLGNSGTKQVRFSGTRLVKQGDGRKFQVGVENTGARYMHLGLWAELYDQNGKTLGRFTGGKRRTYPGTSVQYSLDLSEVPSGTYKALVVADGGGDSVFGATYTLNIRP